MLSKGTASKRPTRPCWKVHAWRADVATVQVHWENISSPLQHKLQLVSVPSTTGRCPSSEILKGAKKVPQSYQQEPLFALQLFLDRMLKIFIRTKQKDSHSSSSSGSDRPLTAIECNAVRYTWLAVFLSVFWRSTITRQDMYCWRLNGITLYVYWSGMKVTGQPEVICRFSIRLDSCGVISSTKQTCRIVVEIVHECNHCINLNEFSWLLVVWWGSKPSDTYLGRGKCAGRAWWCCKKQGSLPSKKLQEQGCNRMGTV